MALDRRQALALGALALLFVVCATAVQVALQTRIDAARGLGERREALARLEARLNGRTALHTPSVAPAAAFVAAATQGLAGAQLQAYVADLAASQQADVVSSSVEPGTREDGPDAIRLQATLDTGLDGLQTLLYRLETGTPYVFVESMAVQPQAAAQAGIAAAGAPSAAAPVLRVTLTLRAMWKREAT